MKLLRFSFFPYGSSRLVVATAITATATTIPSHEVLRASLFLFQRERRIIDGVLLLLLLFSNHVRARFD